MTAALLHYHLRRGGVTRVLEAQSQALRLHGIDHVILAGTPYEGALDLPVVVLPELDYHAHNDPAVAQSLPGALRDAARDALGESPALWHIHNPTLGKNAHFAELLERFAREGEHLLLQFHDFAEDGRPGNYRLLAKQEHLYPLAPQIRYATINSRDRGLLQEAGIPADRLSLLPNAVTPPAVSSTHRRDPSDPPVVLYPVRGIRRKNLGELCLLSGLAPRGATFALSLAPENEEWLSVYHRWADTVKQFQLPVGLGVTGTIPPAPGLEPTYENWLAHSSHLVTTSIAEGFGLAYLEPIALEKPLLGRDLPDITADFKRHNLHLGDLYDRLLIPVSWVDPDKLLRSLREQLREVYHSYQSPLPNGIFKETHQALTRGSFLDFGNLPEDLQEEVLTHALLSPGDVLIDRQGELQPAAEWLRAALAAEIPASPPNALLRYTVGPYADTLASLYRQLLQAAPESPSWLDKSQVLAQFLKPERFHFLRT